MFKNKLPISSLISIAIIPLGISFILIFVLMYSRSQSHRINDYVFLIIGLCFCTMAIALFFRKVYAKIVLTISIFSLNIFLIYTNEYDPERILDLIAYHLYIMGPSLFLILLLYNEKVSIEFGNKHIDKETEDILDQFE